MRLSSFLIVTFGVGVISYPVLHMPSSHQLFMAGNDKQAEPAPKPESGKKEFAFINDAGFIEESDLDSSEKQYHIIVNIPATKLTLYENEKPILTFLVAVGQAIYKTPVSHQEISRIEWNPWWYPPKSEWAKDEKITPPGPKNPLGPVKLPMSEDIRMHGTTKDSSIGHAASHGCIRMHSKDAVTLAWYLQTHLSEKTDVALLEKYKKQSRTTFHVKLERVVPVDIIYNPVVVEADVINFYPDMYGKVKDMKETAEWSLFASGIDPFALDLSALPQAKGNLAKIEVKDLILQ